MEFIFMILICYFIYYKYNLIIKKEINIENNNKNSEHFETYTNIKNVFPKINVPVSKKINITSGEINTITYFIANYIKYYLGTIINFQIQ